MSRKPFLLVGIDSEGDSRECYHGDLNEAVAQGQMCMTPCSDGPAWQSWEVWGNHPDTEEWMPLEVSR